MDNDWLAGGLAGSPLDGITEKGRGCSGRQFVRSGFCLVIAVPR